MCVSGGNAGGKKRKRKEESLGPTQHLLPVAHQEASSMSVIPPSFSDNDGILHKNISVSKMYRYISEGLQKAI